jgi:hypothetical protein
MSQESAKRQRDDGKQNLAAKWQGKSTGVKLAVVGAVVFGLFLCCGLPMIGGGVWLLWPTSKITKANYNKIKDGMTVAAVEGILGKGEEQASVDAGGSVDIPGQNVGGINVPGQKVEVPKMSAKNYVWKDGTKIITITFINDKVTAKAQAGL